MDDALAAWAIAANLVIALSYALVAGWAVPRIRTRGAPPGYLGALVALGVFFATCAATHLALAWHVWSGDAAWMTEPHHLLNHSLQAIAAPVAFTFSAIYLHVGISARERGVEVRVTPKDDDHERTEETR